MSILIRRSLLFVPGSHARAMEKAKTLPADVIIFDLEDGVAPEVKLEARRNVVAALKDKTAYGQRELLVRINRLGTPWGRDDLEAVRAAKPDGLMLPKVEAAKHVQNLKGELTIWANIETPLGILNAAEIAAHPACTALVAGTNDLRAGLGLSHSSDRGPLYHSLAQLILAARAHGKLVFDGTYITFGDPEGLRRECEEGRWLGFDGKTLVHPEQVDICNEVFSPTQEEIDRAREVLAAYDKILAEGRSVGIVDGTMVEELHVKRARAVLAMVENVTRG